MNEPGRVGPVARALGFAGLLPQMAIVVWVALGHWDAWVLATIYAIAILSFLGGTWWGLAMRSQQHQPVLTALAVVPSLAAVGLAVATFALWGSGWDLVAIGAALLLTLLVDRWITRIGIAPEGWMRLRVPLSTGLGALTILAGVLVSGGPTIPY